MLESLRFSDGSSLVLHEDGQLRVLATDARDTVLRFVHDEGYTLVELE